MPHGGSLIVIEVETNILKGSFLRTKSRGLKKRTENLNRKEWGKTEQKMQKINKDAKKNFGMK